MSEAFRAEKRGTGRKMRVEVKSNSDLVGVKFFKLIAFSYNQKSYSRR